MAKINDLIKAEIANLKATLTKDSTKEDIDRVNERIKSLEGIDAEANNILADKEHATTLYLNAIKEEGSKEPHNDGAENNDETPKSLEECMQEVLSKDNK